MERIRERDGLVCGICRKPLESEWDEYERWATSKQKLAKRTSINITIDHKTPRSFIRRSPDFVYEKGWQWRDETNLQLAHYTCNNSKGNGS